MQIINNVRLSNLIKDGYTLEEYESIFNLLKENGTFLFSPLSNGLFSASVQTDLNDYTGYKNVWVRDNIHIAYAHYIIGEVSIAVQNLRTLMEYFKKQKFRFERIIFLKTDFQDPMNRPHVRFEGNQLAEIDQKWAHAQNDALGYFLWLYCKLALEELIFLNDDDIQMILLFISYFERINYWNDEDSGHWEEVRKINASSIGVVLAALKEFMKLSESNKVSLPLVCNGIKLEMNMVIRLIDFGENAMERILPSECIQTDVSKNRRYDSALLFLIYPLQVLDSAMGDQILSDVIGFLKGQYGIKRYLGDSFWAADYKQKLSPEQRTVDFSDNIFSRNNLLQKGQEAQWCLFDSIISIIYGEKFLFSSNKDFYNRQIMFLNRALGQLTGDDHKEGGLKCPELYCLEGSKYVTNDVVPLLWAQANLLVAMNKMKQSIKFNNQH